MTPQTMENDLLNQRIDPTSIVLIIYDEAHKAIGKYAFHNINKYLEKLQIAYRVLALTATPGNSLDKI